MTLFVGSAFVQPLVAILLGIFRFFACLGLAVAVLGDLLLIVFGPGAAGHGGDLVHVPLQAVGLIFVPAVGGLVLRQHRLAGFGDGAPAFHRLQRARGPAITASTATVMETLATKGL